MQGDGVRLVLFRERGGEVEAGHAHEDGGDIAAVWDWMLFSEGFDYVRFILLRWDEMYLYRSSKLDRSRWCMCEDRVDGRW